MKNLTYMIIIAFLLSLTVYSCGKKDDSSTTATSTYTIKGGM